MYLIQSLAFTGLLILSCASFAQETQNIIILSSRTGGSYQSFIDAFIAAYPKKESIKIFSLENPPILKNHKDLANRLIVTVGVKAAKFIDSKKVNAQTVYAMLPFSAYQILSTPNQNCNKKTAVYINQPIQRQLNLSQEIFPRKDKYGVILGDTSKQRYTYEKNKRQFSSENINTAHINSNRELAWSLRSLSNQSDIFIAINDPLVFNANNAKWLLYMAYQQRKPVIGFSKPYVSAGAAASVYSTPAQLGKQTAESVTQAKLKNIECLFDPQYPKYFKVALNKAVIKSLSGRTQNSTTIHQSLLTKKGEL